MPVSPSLSNARRIVTFLSFSSYTLLQGKNDRAPVCTETWKLLRQKPSVWLSKSEIKMFKRSSSRGTSDILFSISGVKYLILRRAKRRPYRQETPGSWGLENPLHLGSRMVATSSSSHRIFNLFIFDVCAHARDQISRDREKIISPVTASRRLFFSPQVRPRE